MVSSEGTEELTRPPTDLLRVPSILSLAQSQEGYEDPILALNLANLRYPTKSNWTYAPVLVAPPPITVDFLTNTQRMNLNKITLQNYSKGFESKKEANITWDIFPCKTPILWHNADQTPWYITRLDAIPVLMPIMQLCTFDGVSLLICCKKFS